MFERKKNSQNLQLEKYEFNIHIQKNPLTFTAFLHNSINDRRFDYSIFR